MQVIAIDEGGIVLIAPGLGIEMQAENKIGPEQGIHAPGPLPYLAASVEKDLTLPAHGLVFERIVRAIEILARVFGSARPENLARDRCEIGRAEWRDRFRFVADKRNAGTERSKFRRQQFRHAQGHLAFLHGRGVAQLEPALLHPGPVTANVAGIERDFQTRERFFLFLTRQSLSGPPGARSRSGGLVVFGKMEGEPGLRVLVHQDAGEIANDANQILIDSMDGVDAAEEPLEGGAGDGSLVLFQELPLRRIGQGIAEAVDRAGGGSRGVEAAYA